MRVNYGRLEALHRKTQAWTTTEQNYDWSGGCICPLGNSQESRKSDDDLYEMGWNMVWYITGSDLKFVSFPHFQTPARTDSTSNGNTYANNRLMVGGARDSSGIEMELEGIVHSIRIKSVEYTATQIENYWLRPTKSPAILCDYFTSMFADLGTQDSNKMFYNSMHGHEGHSVTFENNQSNTPNPSNGFRIQSWKKQDIKNVNFHKGFHLVLILEIAY